MFHLTNTRLFLASTINISASFSDQIQATHVSSLLYPRSECFNQIIWT